MQIAKEKAIMRQKLREIRGTLPTDYFQMAGRNIAERIAACPEYQTAKTVMAFVSTSAEVNMYPFLEKVLTDKKRLAVPLCTAPGIMEARLIDTLEQLAPGQYGIPEPPETSEQILVNGIDVLIVPCVTCSPNGDRLGHGGGYYDRYLENYTGAAILVCPERLMQEEVPMEPLDRKIPIVITELHLYRNGVIQSEHCPR